MRQIEFTPSGDRVGAIGFGAMGLSWVYDRHGLTERRKHEVLGLAVDLGMNVVDTAVLYGGGANEELVGAALAPRRDEVFLCSKTGLRAASLERLGLSGALEALPPWSRPGRSAAGTRTRCAARSRTACAGCAPTRWTSTTCTAWTPTCPSRTPGARWASS